MSFFHSVMLAFSLIIGQVSGGTPWSLIQQRAKVQGVLGADLTSSQEALAYVQGLAERVVGHNIPLTETEKAAITTIKDFIKQMLKDIETQRNEDQHEVNSYRDSIKRCSDIAENKLKTVSNMKKEVDKERQDHRTCRENQVGAYDHKTVVCREYDMYRKTPPGNKPPECMASLTHSDVSTQDPSTKKSMESCVVLIYQWVTPLYKKYIACKDEIDTLDDKNRNCNKEQHVFESAFCQYSLTLTTACDNQKTCRAGSISIRNKGYAAVKISEAARATDCVVGHKVECLLAIFEETDNAKKPGMLDKCKADESYTCPGSIHYPPIPEPTKCDPEPTEPCDHDWLEKEYVMEKWYSKAPTEKCIPCMHSQATTLYVPSFEVYPGYTGHLKWVAGQVRIDSVAGQQTLTWALESVDTKCRAPNSGDGIPNACGLHIHEGFSCHSAGGHHFSKDLHEDPWKKIVYVASEDATTIENEGVQVVTGLTTSEVSGRAFVVHALASGERVACGLIGPQTGRGINLEVFQWHPYPGYKGHLRVDGIIYITGISGSDKDAGQELRLSLSGLDTECNDRSKIGRVPNGCGIHVHEGTSCEIASEVGGHFWNMKTLSEDPWQSVGYVADSSGEADRVPNTRVTTGLSNGDITSRVMVVHALSGERVACGVITRGL